MKGTTDVPLTFFVTIDKREEGENMALHIIHGRAGSGKSAKLRQMVMQQLREQPLGAPIFYLVPDQMSYATEYELTNAKGINGLMRAQVLSFKRLAWYVLQQTAGIAREEVSGYGYRMLIRQLLTEHKAAFSLFRQAAGKRGFTTEVESLLQEFSRYDVTSQLLTQIQQELMATDAPHTLQAKVHDLLIVVQALEQRLGTTYVDSEGFYRLLQEQLPEAPHIKDTTVYIDGFTAFTTREFQVVGQLMQQAKDVYIALPFASITEAMDEQSLFHEAAYTAQALMDFAYEYGVAVEALQHLTTPYRYQTNNLQHIEQSFAKTNHLAQLDDGSVQIMEAASRAAEVHAIAREIVRLTTEQQIRYREIAILYRQAEVYDPLITTIFPQYDIPVFTNTKKPMLHYPLIEFTRSVLEAIDTNWQYEAVFRAIKTDLFFPLASDTTLWRERADRMENFCLAHGIFGERWFDQRRWFYKKYRGLEFHTTQQSDEEQMVQREIEAVRDLIREPLQALQTQLGGAKVGKDYAQALFVFVEQLQVYEKLQAMKEKELNQEAIELATEHDQAWQQWLMILEQFVQLFGEQPLTLDEAISLLDEGLEALTFSRIPPTLDEVQVATVELARLPDVKATFVIGVNEGIYPQKMNYEGLLSDHERDWITQMGYELAPTSTSRLLHENYLIYQAFASPSHFLYVTYPIADEESKALLPSLYIKRLQQMIAAINIQRVVIDPSELVEVDALTYIRHPRAALRYLMRQMQMHSVLPAPWQALYDYYKQDDYWHVLVKRVTKPLTTKNEAETLRPHITEALYGETLLSSISRVEKYYRCPFSHFATYGLKLEERTEYRLEHFTIGDLFHEVLRRVTLHIQQHNLQWRQLTRAQLSDMAERTMQQVAPLLSHEILLSSSRMRYIEAKLLRVIKRTLFALQAHASVSDFAPLAIEAAFGPREPLPALTLPLKNGKEMHLQGRIDRIDYKEINGKPYLRVVDYKSSKRDLRLEEIYHGLSLQVVTYLDVAIRNADYWLQEEGFPAGMLYVHVQNPLLRLQEEVDTTIVEQERLKAYKMTGLLVDDMDVLVAMDENLADYTTSSVVPVRTSKTQGISKHFSRVIAPNDLHDLRKFVEKKHQYAGNQIIAGDTAITPFELNGHTGCEYCSFRSVCQFDVTDGDQHYHKLESLHTDDVLQRVREEDSNDDDTY